MKVRLLGDHSNYHCGSAAAFQTIRAEVERHCEIIDSGDFDTLVVNGEGSMHHNGGGHKSKMRDIQAALNKNRKVRLINSVWQENLAEHAELLRNCEEVVVREVLSQRELESQGVTSSIAIDQAYFAPISEAEVTDYCGEIVFTDFYSNEFGCFVKVNSRWAKQFRFIDMQAMSWSELVKSLSTSSLLVTGRHHAVYAACKARTPFVALAGNTHKIEGLIETSRTKVPMAFGFGEVKEMIERINDYLPAYTELFDWMERQRPWKF